MNFLDELSVIDRELLVSLPYRVGLFISESDDTGGDESEEEELKALDSIVTAYAQEVFGAETVQYVISETVARKSEWAKWSQQKETIHEDCERAVRILERHVDPKEVTAFKRHLLEIGENVAMAFREYGDDTPLMDKMKLYYYYLRGKKFAKKFGERYKEWEQFLNISLDERRAMEYIASAIRMPYF